MAHLEGLLDGLREALLDIARRRQGHVGGPPRRRDGVDAVLRQRRAGSRRLVGVMLESHLVEGRQDEPVTYGQSITDACLGWPDTERLVRLLADG